MPLAIYKDPQGSGIVCKATHGPHPARLQNSFLNVDPLEFLLEEWDMSLAALVCWAAGRADSIHDPSACNSTRIGVENDIRALSAQSDVHNVRLRRDPRLAISNTSAQVASAEDSQNLAGWTSGRIDRLCRE